MPKQITCVYKLTLMLLLWLPNCFAQVTLEVKNSLDFERTEVVALPAAEFSVHKNALRILKDGESEYLPLQWIDYENDGKYDEILFIARVPAKGITRYNLVFDEESIAPAEKMITYARFVPERSDDFAWENDKVAFRVYGPKGQEEALRGVAGSTLSSGVDIWLKRVEYPVIDKWYTGHVKSPGYYHTDRGEGYDPYHVGNSRGTGGTGIWINDGLQVSKNFISYKVIATGPLRTVFELAYAPYSDYKVAETKRITLDTGSNFSKFEVSLAADKEIKEYAVGISLHKNTGDTKLNTKKGWFRYWEGIDDSFLGEGIVMAPKAVKKAFAHISETPDQSNLLVIARPGDKITWYAGFAWKKSGQVQGVSDWDAMLEKQALIIQNPLLLNIHITKTSK